MKTCILIVGHQAYCAHRGVDVTTRVIQEMFCWKGLKDDTRAFVFRCLSCMKAGPAKLIPRPWGTSLRATKPNEILSMDYMHIFPRHDEIKSFLLIIRCNFSTFCELTPSHYGTTTDTRERCASGLAGTVTTQNF